MDYLAYLDDYSLIRLYYTYPNFCDGLEVIYDGKSYPYTFKEYDDHLDIIFEDIDLEKEIYLKKYDQVTYIEYRFVVQTAKFEEEYCPDVYKLGSFYDKEKTIFRFFAPFKDAVELVLDGVIHSMNYKGKGIYELVVEGDIELAKYHYIMIKNNERVSVLDPFAYQKSFSDIDSIVIDVSKIDKTKVEVSYVDKPIIYETSVRDFSSLDNLFKNPRKLVAFKEEGLKIEGHSIGVDYLAELGISHLQLMPILDYDNDKSSYNWGYNPVNYNYFKDEYLVNDGGYKQIEEVQSVIRYLHKRNIRVILDVVFNHVYSTKQFIFNKILPYYFYRYEGEKRANGAGLDNELRTECRFMSNYLVMLMKRLVDIYDIDGLRYDLSGLVDIDTVKNIHEVCSKDKQFITICEGWVMGTCLKDKACNYENANNIKEALFFNSYFREALRGNNERKGFALGDETLKNEIKELFVGKSKYLTQLNSLNYTECHDDATNCDWFFRKCAGESFDLVKKRLKFNLALTILAKGTPFMHSGMEFFRTKNGIDNTYNLPDEINRLDWYRRIEYKDVVEYVRNLIQIRKDIKHYYDLEFISSDYYEMIVFEIDDLKIFINPCPFHHIYTDGCSYNTIFDGERTVSLIDEGVNVNEYSIAIARKQL